MPPASTAFLILNAADGLLADAFAAAKREADDEELTPGEREALLTLPSRLAALEEWLVPSHAAEASLAVDVHTDQATETALVEAAGDLDDLYVVMRAPHTGRLVLAVGVTSSHYEVTEPASRRPTDATWRARLHGSPPPLRAAYTKDYVAPARRRGACRRLSCRLRSAWRCRARSSVRPRSRTTLPRTTPR